MNKGTSVLWVLWQMKVPVTFYPGNLSRSKVGSSVPGLVIEDITLEYICSSFMIKAGLSKKGGKICISLYSSKERPQNELFPRNRDSIILGTTHRMTGLSSPFTSRLLFPTDKNGSERVMSCVVISASWILVASKKPPLNLGEVSVLAICTFSLGASGPSKFWKMTAWACESDSRPRHKILYHTSRVESGYLNSTHEYSNSSALNSVWCQV